MTVVSNSFTLPAKARDGKSAQYIYLKGTARDANNNITSQVTPVVNVNGGTNLITTLGRGLNLVTINRQTLAVADSINYDTYGQAAEGSGTAITALKYDLNHLDDAVFVCLVSRDAIGWDSGLITLLQSFGMSDLPYTNNGRYPFLFIGYKNLGKGNGLTRMRNVGNYYDMVELSTYVANGALTVKDGDKGDDAVTYQIVFTEAWARVDNSNIITARLRGYAYKIEGTTRTPLNNATIRYGYILTESSTYADTTTSASGYFSEDNWFNGDEYGDSGYSQGSKTIFAAIIINNEVMCVEHVLLVKDAAPGQTGSAGKMCYIAGTYDPLQTYTSNASETVAVEVENNNGEVELYILDAATNVVNGVHISPTDGRTDIWRQGLNTYNLIRAKYLFTDFAQLGSFIVSQDFFMSQYGTLVGFGGAIQVTNARTAGKVYMKTVNGKRTPYYACGSSSSGDKPCYLFFDAKDPMAEDVKNGPTFTLEGKGVDDAVIVRRVWFLASEATTVEITLTPSSEANWDFGAVGALDTTVLSASGVTAETVKDGTTPTLLKASGTTALVQTVNVTAGLHFFEIAYLKDSSENQNNDKATFIFAEASNNGYISGFSMLAFRPTKLVNALTGEEWMAQGNMNVSPDGDVMVKGKLVMTSLTVQLADITLWGTSNMFVVGVDTVVGGNSIGGIWNFKCGNNQTIFLPTNRYYYLGQRVILYNSSPNLGGGNGTFVICGDIDEYGMTTEHGFRGVGLFPSYSTPPTPMQLNTYDVVTKIMFFNGILELMCVPSSQNGSTCEWCMTNIGTMFYNFYTT